MPWMAFSEALILSSFFKKIHSIHTACLSCKEESYNMMWLVNKLDKGWAGTGEHLTPINTQSCGSTDHIVLLLTKTFPHYICYCIIQAYFIIKIYLWNFNFYKCFYDTFSCESPMTQTRHHIHFNNLWTTASSFLLGKLTEMLVSGFPVSLESMRCACGLTSYCCLSVAVNEVSRWARECLPSWSLSHGEETISPSGLGVQS